MLLFAYEEYVFADKKKIPTNNNHGTHKPISALEYIKNIFENILILFRKILDYLFQGRVHFSSIEEKWKVKVVGSTFHLKELENTTKYDTPDLKEVVISRFVKDAANGFESDQVLGVVLARTFEYHGTKSRSSSKKAYGCFNSMFKT